MLLQLPTNLMHLHSQAADNLVHFVCSAGVGFMGIAVIGWYMFGGFHPQFRSLYITLGTQFQLLLGNFPDAWQEDSKLWIWTLLFSFVVYYCLLNFLLAIIVEAYMEVHRP